MMDDDITLDSELEALAALAARAGVRWPRRRGARRLDDLPKIRLDVWRGSGLLAPGRKGQVILGGVPITFAATDRLAAFRVDDGEPRVISLTSYRWGRSTRTLGSCPRCHRRVAVLYALDREPMCWRCTGLRPAALQRPLHDRILHRMGKLVALVGGEGVPAVFPPRPKYMKRAYYDRLEAEYHELDEQWDRAAFQHLFPERKS
jgi:hypothetical protein